MKFINHTNMGLHDQSELFNKLRCSKILLESQEEIKRIGDMLLLQIRVDIPVKFIRSKKKYLEMKWNDSSSSWDVCFGRCFRNSRAVPKHINPKGYVEKDAEIHISREGSNLVVLSHEIAHLKHWNHGEEFKELHLKLMEYLENNIDNIKRVGGM
uniref:Uncharacterized protein n=1 Tax=viral metagenome TaxID=1070528 RepID=A0A6M3LTB0_9ZZZZ